VEKGSKKQKVGGEATSKVEIAALKNEKEKIEADQGHFEQNLGKDSVPDKENKMLEVDFEYVAPCEAYFHIIRQLLI